MFAYQCDKLECDLQSKLYDEEGCVDLNKQEGNDLLENELVKKLSGIDAVLIDNGGFAHNNQQRFKEMKKLFLSEINLETHLVLPSNMKSKDLNNIINSFNLFPISYFTLISTEYFR